MNQYATFPQIVDQIIKTVFQKHIFLFYTLISKMLKTCVICVTNCVITKIYPLEDQILELFVLSNFTDNCGHFPQIWNHIINTVFPNFFNVSTLSSRMSINFVTNCVTPKRALVRLFLGKMNLDMIEIQIQNIIFFNKEIL